jgi:hypothetical protein
LTFPNGAFGSFWVLGFYLFNLLEGLLALFITTPLFAQMNNLFTTASFPVILGILIYRYRRHLKAKERAAIKWLIVSWSVFIAMLILFTIVEAMSPVDSLLFLLSYTIGFFGCGINIAGFLMAVLYANVFDIDVFVRHVLVYGMLTISLALIYAGMVIGLGAPVRLLTGELGESPVAIVVSTLAIAALFQPLRKRLQAIIDRRFYRHKYDAAKTLAAFSGTISQELNVDQLCEKLVAVATETMQPAHVSLWLRPPASASKKQKAWNATHPVLPSGEEKSQPVLE